MKNGELVSLKTGASKWINTYLKIASTLYDPAHPYALDNSIGSIASGSFFLDRDFATMVMQENPATICFAVKFNSINDLITIPQRYLDPLVKQLDHEQVWTLVAMPFQKKIVVRANNLYDATNKANQQLHPLEQDALISWAIIP